MEGGDDVRGNQWPPVGDHVMQRIERNGEGEISGIEIDDVVAARGRHAVGDGSGQISVRINQGEASIGVEIDNAGPMNQVGDRFMAWFGREYPASEVLMAAHKHGGPVRPWHVYTEAQISRCLELAELLVQHYGLQDVLGHDDIARGRKQDPGPAFPLASIAGRALGRGDDEPVRYIVSTDGLNIRKGPDAGFDSVAPPLARGTLLRLIEPGSRWSKVEVDGPSDVEGWVNNHFIVRLKDAPRSLLPRSREAAPARAGPPAKRAVERVRKKVVPKKVMKKQAKRRAPTQKTKAAR